MPCITACYFKPCHVYSYLISDHTVCIHISLQPISHITACDCRPRSPCPHRKCLVAGFFENKEADAKARGQKLPKKKDPKQEYDNFLKSIADDVQEVEARQEVEAVEAAQDKADQEAFEHGCALRLCISCTSQSCVLHKPCPFNVFHDVLALCWLKPMHMRHKLCITLRQSDLHMIACNSGILPFAT